MVTQTCLLTNFVNKIHGLKLIFQSQKIKNTIVNMCGMKKAVQSKKR